MDEGTAAAAGTGATGADDAAAECMHAVAAHGGKLVAAACRLAVRAATEALLLVSVMRARSMRRTAGEGSDRGSIEKLSADRSHDLRGNGR